MAAHPNAKCRSGSVAPSNALINLFGLCDNCA
jgi:hypothetical protein